MIDDMVEDDEVVDAEVVDELSDDLPVPSRREYGHALDELHRGRGYLINHINGGQSEIAAKDDVQFKHDGILVRHNDPAQSFTFYPWYNIVWIREHATKSGRP